MPVKVEDGESPVPQCLLATELLRGKSIENFDLNFNSPPFDITPAAIKYFSKPASSDLT